MDSLYAKAKALSAKSEKQFHAFMSERGNKEVEFFFTKAIASNAKLAARFAAYHADCFPLIEEARKRGVKARVALESAIQYSAQRHVRGEEQPDWQGLRTLREVAGPDANEAIQGELATFLAKAAASKKRVVVPADFGALISKEHRSFASIRKS